MTKAQLVKALADRSSLSKAQAEETFNHLIDLVQGSLKKGERIALPGLGSLSVAMRKARMGRNPQTGEPLKIPASKKVRFSAAKELKEMLGIKKRRR
ncbi:MAG: HU family DNA-binding protein [Deltaproteobacteria bacterium]|nr:HU family DNA-binding protein [Deltaproteobacteria bacterium]